MESTQHVSNVKTDLEMQLMTSILLHCTALQRDKRYDDDDCDDTINMMTMMMMTIHSAHCSEGLSLDNQIITHRGRLPRY